MGVSLYTILFAFIQCDSHTGHVMKYIKICKALQCLRWDALRSVRLLAYCSINTTAQIIIFCGAFIDQVTKMAHAVLYHGYYVDVIIHGGDLESIKYLLKKMFSIHE